MTQASKVPERNALRLKALLTQKHVRLDKENSKMKQNLTLNFTSLLSILLMTFHMTQDTLRAKAGTAEAGGLTFIVVPILVVWLYGTLPLAERRSGHIIMLVGSLL